MQIAWRKEINSTPSSLILTFRMNVFSLLGLCIFSRVFGSLKHLRFRRAWEDAVSDVSRHDVLVIELVSAFGSSFVFGVEQRCGPV